jgi:hypothetical protein
METPSNQPLMAWAAEMPLLTGRFFLYDFAKLFVILAVAVSGLVLVISAASGSMDGFLPLLEMFGCVIAGIIYLFALVTWLIFRNRFPVGFRIDGNGVAWYSLSRTGKVGNRLAIVAGLMGGNLGAAGAGILAVTQESGRLEWSEIRRIKPHPEDCVISLMNSWRVVTRLYCTPENYQEALSLLDSQTRGAGAAAGQGGC